MELTEGERWILSNQFEILKRSAEPHEIEYLDQAKKVVELGYALLYDEYSQHIHEEMPRRNCQEVVDILNMFRTLKYRYEELESKPSNIEPSDVEFEGFDGNNESQMYAFARFFVLEMEHFGEIAEYRNDDLNSHSPKLDGYRAMLRAWKSISDERRYKLTAEDIELIVNASRQQLA